MQVHIEGEIRREMKVGFGPFRKTRWHSQAFTCVVFEDGNVSPEGGVKFYLEKGKRSWVLGGAIGPVPCSFGEFPFDGTVGSFSFHMLSVGTIEVKGRAFPVNASSAHLHSANERSAPLSQAA